jgi:hypothetical protein
MQLTSLVTPILFHGRNEPSPGPKNKRSATNDVPHTADRRHTEMSWADMKKSPPFRRRKNVALSPGGDRGPT